MTPCGLRNPLEDKLAPTQAPIPTKTPSPVYPPKHPLTINGHLSSGGVLVGTLGRVFWWGWVLGWAPVYPQGDYVIHMASLCPPPYSFILNPHVICAIFKQQQRQGVVFVRRDRLRNPPMHPCALPFLFILDPAGIRRDIHVITMHPTCALSCRRGVVW